MADDGRAAMGSDHLSPVVPFALQEAARSLEDQAREFDTIRGRVVQLVSLSALGLSFAVGAALQTGTTGPRLWIPGILVSCFFLLLLFVASSALWVAPAWRSRIDGSVIVEDFSDGSTGVSELCAMYGAARSENEEHVLAPLRLNLRNAVILAGLAYVSAMCMVWSAAL